MQKLTIAMISGNVSAFILLASREVKVDYLGPAVAAPTQAGYGCMRASAVAGRAHARIGD